MKPRARFILPALFLLSLAHCGDSGDDGGITPPPDAGPINPDCSMSMSFPDAALEAPGTIAVIGRIDARGLSGFQRYFWQVRFNGSELAVEQNPDTGSMSFYADQPGPYTILLSGEVESVSCYPANEVVNVAPVGIDSGGYIFRFVPHAGQPAAVQELRRTIASGVDYDLGEIALEGGIEVSGVVRGHDGTPLPAYLRVTPAGVAGAAPIEAFADATGAFSLRLADGRYDVLVVPQPPNTPDDTPDNLPDTQATSAWAPLYLTDQPLTALAALTVPEGIEVTGTVVSAQGQGLPDTRISLRPGPIPSTVTTTEQDGGFALPAQLGGADATMALEVIPPPELGLPWLVLPPSDVLASALALDPVLSVAYQPTLESVLVSPEARAAGAPAPGARATWIARSSEPPLDDAGSVILSGGDRLSIPGQTRVSAVADDSGVWPPVVLPRGVYDVLLEPAGAGHVTWLEADLTAALPTALTLSEPATLTGAVVDEDGIGLPAIRVTAQPLGLLAQVASAGAGTVTDAEGRFSLSLVGDGDYELILDGLDQRYGRHRVVVTAPASGTTAGLNPIALYQATRVSGRVTIAGLPGGASGVTVVLSCAPENQTPACQPAGSGQSLAEASTNTDGRFVLAVPTPSQSP